MRNSLKETAPAFGGAEPVLVGGYPQSKGKSSADLLKELPCGAAVVALEKVAIVRAKAKNAASTIDEEVSNDFAAGPDLAKCAKREVRMGVLTGTSMPGRRSTPVGSIILLQRAVYRSELRIELRADALWR